MNRDYQAIDTTGALTAWVDQPLQGMAVHDVLAEFLFDVGVTGERECFPGVLNAGGALEKSLDTSVGVGDFSQIPGELDIFEVRKSRGDDLYLSNIIDVVACQADALDRIFLFLRRLEKTLAYSHKPFERLESSVTVLERAKSDEICV
ncbi:hypothetical protein HG531_002248 [Fusarium graminearum]|nr:hypothetical protein HG531_002248 [Fusarium graminearum]